MKNQNNIFSLKNKVVIITGAGRGIGQHIAENIAKSEAQVFAIDKKFSKKVTKNLSNIKCDITNESEFKKICDKIFKQKKTY